MNAEHDDPRKQAAPSVRAEPLYSARIQYTDPYYGDAAGPTGDVGLLGKVTISRVIRVLSRKWMTVAMAIGVTLLLAIIYLIFTSRVYRADALIEMSMRKPRIMGAESAVIDDAASSWGSEEIFNTRVEKFKSDETRRIAAQKLKTLLGKPEMSDEEADGLLPAPWDVDFRMVPRTRLLRIAADAPSAKLAAAVANAFAQASESVTFEENRLTSDSAVAWLQSQVEQQRKELEAADRALLDFRAKTQVDDLEAQKKALQESLVEFNATLVKLESQRLLAQEMVVTLDALDRSPESAGRIPLTIPRQEEINEMLRKWMEAIAERETMKTRLTAKHPDMLAQEETIQVARKQLQEAVQRARDTVQSDLTLVENQIKSLKNAGDERRAKIAELDLQIVKHRTTLSSLERKRDASDMSYRGVLNRIEEARLSADENTAIIKIVKPATPPAHPIKPRAMRILAIAFIIGGFIGMGLALFTDNLEDYITSTQDIEADLGLKVLGLIPHMPVTSRDQLALASLNDRFSQVAEAFAGVRSLIDSMAGAKLGRSVLVVSTTAEEGKTITSCNLAIMTAKRGLKTLIVDFDLRRPRVGRMFGVAPHAESLIHALHSGDPAQFDRLPNPTQCENLDVISSRPTRDISAAEIMGSRIVKEFMAWAEKRYDRVIVDSPPYGIVSDAVSLAGLTGCLVLVCRPNKSRKRATNHAIKRLSEAGANILGVVVNDVDFSKGAFLSNYSYQDTHYNYRDHYGSDGKHD